jgi:hypothetical protein
MIEFQLPAHASHSAINNYLRCGSLEDRFWAKVEPTGFCWNWVAGKTTAGYGSFSLGKEHGGKIDYAHRVSYELLVGPIPEGLHLDHLCRNRGCVNPDHLEPVTCKTNVQRSPTVGRHRAAECKRGHPLTGENVRIRKNGERWCLECSRLRRRGLI